MTTYHVIQTQYFYGPRDHKTVVMDPETGAVAEGLSHAAAISLASALTASACDYEGGARLGHNEYAPPTHTVVADGANRTASPARRASGACGPPQPKRGIDMGNVVLCTSDRHCHAANHLPECPYSDESTDAYYDSQEAIDDADANACDMLED